jgi:pSer/pThr/pTyr-binding forkhead associated (FHA) protein
VPIRIRIPAVAPGATERVVEIADAAREIRVGSAADLELPLPLPGIAALHARIFRGPAGEGWQVEDLGSAGGSWLGAERLAPGAPRPLPAGSALTLARTALLFDGEAAPVPNADGTATIARRLVRDLFAGDPRAAAPELEVVVGPEPGRRLALRESDRPYLVGRGAACDLALVIEEISREHAAFVWTGEGVVVRDLGSKNGVLVAGARVGSGHRLRDGDVVELGSAALRLDDPTDRYLRELEGPPPGAPAEETPGGQDRQEDPEPDLGSRSSPWRPGVSSSSTLPTVLAVVALAIVAAAVALLLL